VSLEDFPEFDKAVEVHLDNAVAQLADEFKGIYDEAQIRPLVMQSARQLFQGNVAAFVPILAYRFARERLQAQAKAEGKVPGDVVEVLFVSLTGSGRAQMGAALLSQRVGNAVSAHSAGSAAAGGIDENVVAAMEETGADMSESFTKPLTPEVLADADVVVTMGRSVGAVEVPPQARHVDWRVGDPAGADLDEVRRVREDIERRVELLAEELLAGRPEAAHSSS
jgi:protein-tyrosine-phosphatase